MRIMMIALSESMHAIRPLNWLLERGHEVIFLDHRNPYPERRDRFFHITFPSLPDKIAIPLLQKIYRETNPDIVHVHWVDHRAYQCVRAGLKPLIYSVWGSDINTQFIPDGEVSIDRRLIKETLTGADLIIVDEKGMAEKCRSLAGHDPAFENLHLGINTDVFRKGYIEAAESWRQSLAINPASKVILSARAMKPYYNHQMVLEAFARAYPYFDMETVLAIRVYDYIDERKYEMSLRCQAIELGIASKVRWINKVEIDRLPEIYALSDIVVNNPSRDTFPITFLEAAACERRVVTCRLPSYLGTFAENYFQMFTPGDSAGLSNALIQAVNTSSACNEDMLAEARQHVLQNFDESHYIDRLLQIYDQLSCKRKIAGSVSIPGNRLPSLSGSRSPTVSILIPTYNRARFITDAVQSALMQSSNDFEIVIVDDGSADTTPEVVKGFDDDRLRYVRKDHTGAPDTRNRCIEEARGEFVLWLDSDDRLLPHTLETYKKILAQYPDADVVYGDLEITDACLFPQRKVPYPDWYRRNGELLANFFKNNAIPNPGTMVRKTCYDKFGGYDKSFTRAHDYDWWVRLAKTGTFKHAGIIVAQWRWHDSNMSSGTVRIDTGYEARIVQGMLEKFSLQQLMPCLDWAVKPTNSTEATAWIYAAKRFLELGDINRASECSRKSYQLFPIPETLKIVNQLTPR